MKKLVRFLLFFVILIVLALASVSIYVAVNGKTILLTELEKNLGIKAKLSSIRFIFPRTLVAEGLELSDALKIKRVVLVPSFSGILGGDVGLNALVLDEPEATIIRNPDDSFDYGLPALKGVPPEIAQPEKLESVANKEKKAKKLLRFYVNKLDITNARVKFIDKSFVGQAPFEIECFPLNLNMSRPSVLHFFRMQFNGQGSLLSRDDVKIGEVVLSGWADPVSMDMDANAQLEGSNLAYFSSYYSKFIKKELETGQAKVSVIAQSKSNDMSVDCHVEVKNISFKKAQEPQSGEQANFKDFSDIGAVAFDSILGKEGMTTFDFSIRTKMDQPKFENIKLKGNFFQSRVEAVLSKPPQETIKDLKQIGEEFQAIGKQFKEIFKKD